MSKEENHHPAVNGQQSAQNEAPTTQRLDVVSFFAGCGGLDLGFKGDFSYKDTSYPALPFNIRAAYELDKHCKTTYEKNLSSPFHLCDLKSADVGQMPAADILIGGFPCQEFSICGPKGGFTSKRGGLYKAMSRYAKKWQPALVIAENVSHLPRLNGGLDLAAIKRSFKNAGYRCALWKLFAPDYGIPQARDRVILIFVRNDLTVDPMPPPKLFKDSHRSVKWAIQDLQKIKDETVPNQSQYFKANLAKNGHGQGDERSPANAPGYTVRANAKSRIQFHYSLKRRLTVRECARLQTFPDSFAFPHAATENIKQIGNAVPPLLGYVVAAAIARYVSLPEVRQKLQKRDGG
ncbi:DNA cytosine methyltransferase [Polaromonas sp. YR568]|uniref:DNA cytosine methyltransferase n=1 Tax=Polaromonas sp. YR568 TaxID=1855301 RepID=UPI00398BD9FB